MESNEREWTSANLKKLFGSLKNSIAARDKTFIYSKGLKTIDWEKVAFPPFSAEQCREKWTKTMQKIRKVRTLTELAEEAENVLSDPSDVTKRQKDDDVLPQKPPGNGYALFCMEQASSVDEKLKTSDFNEWARRWGKLTEIQRMKYTECSNEQKKQYASKLNAYLMKFSKKEQQEIIKERNIHLPKGYANKNKAKWQNEPKMPSLVGYSIFCQEQMEALRKKFPQAADCFREGHKMWKSLPENEKERYKSKVQERRKKYSMELGKWFLALSPTEREEYWKSNLLKKKFLREVIKFSHKNEPHIPSDSEDEDIEMSSSDEEEYKLT